MARPIFIIAEEVWREWKKVWYGAAPYLDAMKHLVTIEDSVLSDDGRYIVRGFLGNAKTWRGETARRIKAELKELLEGKEH